MSKRHVQTVLTPLPPGVPRDVVFSTLRNHLEMIDLNPLVESRTKMTKPPAHATAEEYHCTWYELVDKVQYVPGMGSMGSGRVTYSACFHDLPTGVQTHVYAPLGLDIKEKWTVGGTLPGEPKQPVELGLNIPKDGLYLREDIDMKCNIMVLSFVKKNLKKAHRVLVERMVEKAKLETVKIQNENISRSSFHSASQGGPPPLMSPGAAPPQYGQSYDPYGVSRSNTTASTYSDYKGHAGPEYGHMNQFGQPQQGFGQPQPGYGHPFLHPQQQQQYGQQAPYDQQHQQQQMSHHSSQNSFVAELPAAPVPADAPGAPGSSHSEKGVHRSASSHGPYAYQNPNDVGKGEQRAELGP